MNTTDTQQTASAQPENSARFETVEASRSFVAPAGYDNGSTLRAHAKAYQLNGNQHPHFSVTGEIGTKRQFETGDWQAVGCLHDEISKAWPSIRPIIALHLSNADDGEPMHAEANGYYWLAGAVGGLDEQYHGGIDNTPDECLQSLVGHLRLTLEQASDIANEVRNAFDSVYANKVIQPYIKYAATMEDTAKAARTVARNRFHDFVIAQRDRWQAEAEAGIALIKKLSACD